MIKGSKLEDKKEHMPEQSSGQPGVPDPTDLPPPDPKPISLAPIPEDNSEGTSTAPAKSTPVADLLEESAAPVPEAAPTFEEPVFEEKPAPPPREEVPLKRPQRHIPLKQPRETFRLVTVVSAVRTFAVTFAAAVITATIFMWWTSPDFLPKETQKFLAPVQQTAERVAVQPTALPTPIWFNRIGVLAGHSGIATYGRTKGNVDPGTTCPDNFTEASVTLNVATRVRAILQGRGFTVDMLEEFDLRLDNYRAAAFISLHADSCEFYNDGFEHSGFKVAYPVERFTARDQDLRLEQCIRENYGAVTGLKFTPAGITEDMTKYHAFGPTLGHPGIAATTPGAILEIGLLSYDRDLLQNRPDRVAQGVVNGLLCYLDPTGQSLTPVPPLVQASPNGAVPTPTLQATKP